MRSLSLAIVLLLTACEAPAAASFRATVERVADGDSFHVRDEKGRRLEVRLMGIDAPERSQPYADQSRRALISMVRGKTVVVQVFEPDRHGRLVSRVTKDGTDVALAQLKTGMAWVYPWAQTIPAGYRDAERVARAERAGLWRDRRPVPPWEFRRRP